MSALALADVRWRSRRDPGGGPPLVHVSFLTDPADRRTASIVAGVGSYLAALAGRPRREYDADVPVEIAGDRRLGNGLATVCMDWYRWTARSFAEALPPPVAEALERAGVDTPSSLRLRLFDVVNEAYAGFVPSAQRDEALALLAAAVGLGPDSSGALDTAMGLDAEDEAVLVPTGPAPGVADIVGRYNQAVLAALLRQAERIVFTVHAPDGALIRRLYALCRRLGVYCDVEAATSAPALEQRGGGGGAQLPLGPAQPPPARAQPLPEVFRLTLSGPDAVVGPPAAAGPRLAIVAMRLLRQTGPSDTAVADLVLRERPYRLVLDRALLGVPGLDPGRPTPDRPGLRPTGRAPLPKGKGGSEGIGESRGAYVATPAWSTESSERESEDALSSPTPHSPLPTPSYDSEVEARLAREFAALERQGRAAGWRLVREPAPLLAGGRVLIPDFALVRGDLRVFVEVAGFWTPGYLTRKRAALEGLAPEVPLVLAVAEESAAALSGLPFPVVPYRTAVRVHELLAVAEARYGDFAVRTAGATERLAAACAAVNGAGWLPEPELAGLLGCHSPGEIVRALAGALPPGWEYVAGAGLCGPSLRAALSSTLEEAWARSPDAALTPADVRALLPDTRLPATDDGLVALLERTPACAVARPSLFAVEVRPPGSSAAPTPPSPADAPAPPSSGRPRRATGRSSPPGPGRDGGPSARPARLL